LWLIHQCLYQSQREGWHCDDVELARLAAASGPDVPLFDPDHESARFGGHVGANRRRVPRRRAVIAGHAG
jgi:hypothetical protein